MRGWIRGTVNALLVAVLLRPMLRRLMASKRRQAEDFAESTIVIPARQLIGSILPAQLVAAPAGAPTADDVDEMASRDVARTVFVAGAVAAAAAIAALVIATVVRRRSRATAAPAVDGKPVAARKAVAVPVGAPDATSQGSVGPGARGEDEASTSPEDQVVASSAG